MPADETPVGRVNVGALTLGVGTLITLLGTFTLTGAVGRVLRNDPEQLRTALVLLLLGAAFLAAAGLPLTHGLVESTCSLAGLVLTFVGLLLGVLAGARSPTYTERPAINAHLAQDGLQLEGSVKVANLPSTKRLVVIVDGLRSEAGGRLQPTTIHRAYVGPDSEGEVDVPLTLRVPGGTYDSLGVRAWTSGVKPSDSGDDAGHRCGESDTNGPDDVGTGCIVVPLPPVATSPHLTMAWAGKGQNARQLEIAISSDNAPIRRFVSEGCKEGSLPPVCPPTEGGSARVGISVRAVRRGDSRLLYRALLRPDGRGDLDEVVRVPIRRRMGRICAVAAFVYGHGGFPKSTCPVGGHKPGRTAVELRPVGARAHGS
jgi:hypothetical protein